MYLYLYKQVPNEKEVVGILNEVGECRVATSTIQYRFVSEVMCWIDRHKLNDQKIMQPHVQHCVPYWVDGLLEAWRLVKAKNHKDRLVVFWGLHKAKLEMIFASTDLNPIFANLSNCTECKDSLYKCSAANLLGKALFNEQLQALLSDLVHVAVRNAIERHLKGKRMTEDLWRDTARLALQAAALVDAKGLMAPRRTVKVSYRGVDVQVRVGSLLAEVECWLSAKLKEYAVEAGCTLKIFSQPPTLRVCININIGIYIDI